MHDFPPSQSGLDQLLLIMYMFIRHDIITSKSKYVFFCIVYPLQHDQMHPKPILKVNFLNSNMSKIYMSHA